MRTRIVCMILLCVSVLTAQARKELLLEKNWKFSHDDLSGAIQSGFDDTKWQSVTVPHDWAVYGPFDGNADLQNVAIVQDGETRASRKSGRTGGLPYIGVGWYRTHFDAPGFNRGQSASILFDGAMSNARVYLNGYEVGYWPYGYNSFYFDIAPYLKEKDNTLAVRLENLSESSRWYPGAGLYRNVHVFITEDAHIPVWGTQLTTPEVNRNYAKVKLNTQVELPEEFSGKLSLVTEIKDGQQKVVSRTETVLTKYDNNTFKQDFVVESPRLWTPASPDLYIAESKLYADRTLKDEYSTRFGIRRVEIIPEKGMFLNGEAIKFRGVCNHHDLGPLGAAINKSALRRQLTILKDMGCNAIRTSHNMPAPELVELCDEMGFMMMVESFDEWNIAKCKNGYHLYFDEWAEKDMVNMVHNFRNNPSVVMWSIGNEVPGQGSPLGLRTARFLQDICHREDPTRLVTMGIDNAQGAINSHLASTIDVVGFTYRLQFYQKAYQELAQRVVLGAETASTISSRGTYYFPVVGGADKKHDDNQCSGYDVEHCSWSNLPDDDFIQHDDYPWAIGEFVWTGFDYLGEPTPYGSNWPNHSSMFGIIDLAGIPKDRYYLYRSHWNPTEETLHILPHWTWSGREGETTPVFVYSNYPSAELFVNGKSQGRAYKDESLTAEKTDNEEARRQLLRQRRYRLMWMDVKYEPGTLKVVAYDEKGKAVAEQEVHTAGKPDHLELTTDRTSLASDGKDLSFITVKVVDKNGNLCPEATHSVRFKVTGAGTYRAAANGDATNLEQFHLPKMSAFKGQLVAIVQSSEQGGKIQFEAEAKGLKKAVISLQSK
ncbi:Beta-galactosidase [termite gut metagenome]|uniref:Beta-galactosidase n=2 Tax=termite gut metagenome TaxID=433724 RepID=A0A5J4S7F6_9ZZZZ